MSAPEIFAIVAAIKEAYLSLENPNFAFVGRAIAEQGYAHLLNRLQQIFEVRETTDENDDVAFIYLVSCNDQDLGLWISMVGPYALIQRVEDDHVKPLREPHTTIEAEILAALSACHVVLVSDAVLRHRIKMNLSEAEDGKVTVYQALFDNSQALPRGEQEGDGASYDA